MVNPLVKRRPLQTGLRPDEFSGLAYLLNDPAPTDWLLKDSLPHGAVGVIVAPPGTGKGFLSIQLLTRLAAGLDCFSWQIETPRRGLYISAEESPNVVHRRIRAALWEIPAACREAAACAVHGLSVSGSVSLVETAQGGRLEATANFDDLDALIDLVCPEFIILDVFARFLTVNENDNAGLTAAFGLLEELARRRAITILSTHHMNKTGSVFADSDAAMKSNLSLQSIRGGTAVSGCGRWVLMMSPLASSYASKLFGESPAAGRPDGTFVAARVVKKNEGGAEDVFFLEHGPGGLFRQVHKAGQADGASDVDKLVAEVARRADVGEPSLSLSRAGCDAFAWGTSRNKRAVEAALESGVLVSQKVTGRKGYFLFGGKFR